MFKYNRKLGLADIIIQGIFFAGILISILGLIEDNMAVLFILVFQFFLGLYQIGSGIVGAVKRRKWKMNYLGVVFVYVIVGGISAVLLENARWHNDLAFVLAIFIGIVIPLLIGLGYFILNIKEYQKSERVIHSNEKNLEDESLLDDLLSD